MGYFVTVSLAMCAGYMCGMSERETGGGGRMGEGKVKRERGKKFGNWNNT